MLPSKLRSHSLISEAAFLAYKDVTDDKSVNAAAAKVEATYRRLDVLVNNAGVYSEKQPARDTLHNSLPSISSAQSVQQMPSSRSSANPRCLDYSS
jgi:NAD(P)-dependent dehydrogenase (short-subunit alcohol dehydrogenase family)